LCIILYYIMLYYIWKRMQICLEMEQPNSAIEMLWSGQSRVSKCRVPTHCLRKRGIKVPRASKYLTCCEHKWNQRNPSCLHTFCKLFGMFVRFCALSRLLRFWQLGPRVCERKRPSSAPATPRGQSPAKARSTVRLSTLPFCRLFDLLTCWFVLKLLLDSELWDLNIQFSVAGQETILFLCVSDLFCRYEASVSFVGHGLHSTFDWGPSQFIVNLVVIWPEFWGSYVHDAYIMCIMRRHVHYTILYPYINV
jgi:hypothetical protein